MPWEDIPWSGKRVRPGVALVKTGKPDVFIDATFNSALQTIYRPNSQTAPCGQWARFGLLGPPSSKNRTHLSGSDRLLATVILLGSAGCISNPELRSAEYLFLPASLDPCDSDWTFPLEFTATRHTCCVKMQVLIPPRPSQTGLFQWNKGHQVTQ